MAGRFLAATISMFFLPLIASAAEGDWGFNAEVAYGERAIDGTIFVNRPGPTAGGATTDSLGLGKSGSFMYAVGFRYKRWNFTFNSMPTTYDGQGFGIAEIDFGGGTSIPASMPITSNIDVNLLLLNVMYDVFNNDYGKFSAGVGLGRTSIDVALVPALGQPVAFDGNTPFGYLALHYVKRFGQFSLTAAAQGISVSVDDSSMAYSNVNLMGGYLFYDSKWRSEILLGYRRVGFDFHYDVEGGVSDTDMTLTGPYLGVAVGF